MEFFKEYQQENGKYDIQGDRLLPERKGIPGNIIAGKDQRAGPADGRQRNKPVHTPFFQVDGPCPENGIYNGQQRSQHIPGAVHHPVCPEIQDLEKGHKQQE